jgi:hypothetical protein
MVALSNGCYCLLLLVVGEKFRFNECSKPDYEVVYKPVQTNIAVKVMAAD